MLLVSALRHFEPTFQVHFPLPHHLYPPPPLSFPTPRKTVPHHPLWDGHQVTVPHPPPGDHTPKAGRGREGARGSERRRTDARSCKTVLPSRS